MTTLSPHLGAAAVAIAISALAAAQSAVVIPASAATRDANSASAYPFSDKDRFRFSQIVDGGEVCSVQASITSLSFRRDAANQQSYRSHTYPAVSLVLMNARTTPMTMSRQFTQNWGPNPAIVFQGPLNLPSQPPVAGVAPWNVALPFSQPYSYLRSQGDLLFELSEYNLGGTPGFYKLDAHAVAHGAGTVNFGQKGATSLGENYFLGIEDGNQLYPGGRITVRFGSFRQPYSAVLGFGASSTVVAGHQLPLALGFVGAPGNFMYHSWDVQLGFTIGPTPLMGIHEGLVRLSAPDVPGLLGATIFAQALVLDLPANPLGLVFSDRLDLHFARVDGPFQSIGATGTISGSYLAGRAVLAAPVFRLQGTFQ